MSINININDESTQDIIEESFSNNIFDEYAKDFVSLLIDYKTQEISENTKANMTSRYINLLAAVIYSNDDWCDFCQSLYNRSQQFWNDNHYSRDVYMFIQQFVKTAQTEIAQRNSIILGEYPFDPIGQTNPSADFLVSDSIVFGNLEDTTGIEEGDNEELQGLLSDMENVSDGSTNYGYDLSLNITDAITQYVELTVQSLIVNGAVNILNKLGINQDTLEIAHRIIDIADTAVFAINSIIPCIPKNIMFTPDSGAMLSSITSSLKDMFLGMWMSLENMYYETINQAITNLPSWEEIQKDAIDVIIELGLALIDQQCVKYTGHTLVELYYMCTSLIQLYKAYKEARRQMRELESEGYDVDVNKTLGFSISWEMIKEQLLRELENASDLLFNSFIILEIREAFLNIKELISQFHNIDLNVLVEGMNSLQDFMDLLDEIGINENSWTVSLSEAIEIGINDFQNQFKGFLNQTAALGIATGVNMVNDVIQNISFNPNLDINITKAFEFKNNTDDFTITLVIYKNPLVDKIQKNLVKVLTGAVDNENKKIFDAGEVMNIMTTLKDAYNKRKDCEIEMLNFTFKIHFEIEGFNQSAMQDAIDIVTQTLKDLEEKKELEKQAALDTFELGVITEEYTENPDLIKRRPTLQIIHDIYALMQKFFPILKVFATLISNYKINKAKVQNNSKGNIFAMKRVLAKANKLLNSLNTDNKNFYTVRTLKTFDYIDKNIHYIDYYGIRPSEDSSQSMNTVRTLDIDKDETKKLYDYLQFNNIDNGVIKPDKETTLYIDVEALNEQKEEMDENINAISQFFGEDAHLFVSYPETNVKDGTYDGLDKIDVIENEVYYTDSYLPVIGSQILQAYQKNKDVSI